MTAAPSPTDRPAQNMPRFYCDQPLSTGMLLTLPDAVARHVQVLRLSPGDVVTVFNGCGGEYAASLVAVEKKLVQAELKAFDPREAELDYGLTLAQGLPEGSKMDWIVEKCGRNRLPALAEPPDFDGWIARQDLHRRVLLSPRGEQSLSDWARHRPPQALTLVVGPEGGFSQAEEDLAVAHGALCLSMGPRVLRTETAGLAALAAVNAVWGAL